MLLLLLLAVEEVVVGLRAGGTLGGRTFLGW